jgi:hypothetical protein
MSTHAFIGTIETAWTKNPRYRGAGILRFSMPWKTFGQIFHAMEEVFPRYGKLFRG